MSRSSLILAVTFCVLVVLSQWNLLSQPGLPVTHDSQNHLARFANYYSAVKQGQIPPRWAPNLNNEFGYPVFNFNYPLANIIAIPLIALNISVQNSLKIEILATLLLSFWGMFFWLRSYFKDNSSLVASFYYALSPYVLTLVYVRGVIGENWAYVLLPLVLGLIDRVLNNKSRTLIYQWLLAIVGGAFLISHNIMVFFSIPILLGYVFYKIRRDYSKIRLLVMPGMLALLLSMFFWLPALWEKQFIVLDQSQLNKAFIDHFATINQLVLGRGTSGFSRVGPVDGLNMGVGLIAVFVLILIPIVWLRNKYKYNAVIFLYLFTLVIIFFMTFYSQIVWTRIPLVQFIQFPWRLGIFIPLTISFLLAYLLNSLRNSIRYILTVVIIISVGAGIKNYSLIERFDFPDDYWSAFRMTTSTKNENMPKWLIENPTVLKDLYFQDKPVYDSSGLATFSQINWQSHQKSYLVDADGDTTIVHQLIYFPGMKVYLDDYELVQNYNSPDFQGLVTIPVSDGNHQVEIKFTQRTWARMIGNTITLIALIILIIQMMGMLWNKKYDQ
jgi:hypothetical protein